MHIKNYRKKFKKFTLAFGLIEVMIAATLLSIGLLGAASIQTQSLNMTLESSLRETAIRMTNQLSNFILTMDNSVDNPELQTMISLSATTADTDCNNTNNCPSGKFYAALLAGWKNSLHLLLPNGKGCLCFNPENTSTINPAPPSIRLAIQWVNLSGDSREYSIDQPITSSITGINCTAATTDNPSGCAFS